MGNDSWIGWLIFVFSSSESSVTVYGKEYNVPRLVAAYGDNGVKYTYSRRTLSTTPWVKVIISSLFLPIFHSSRLKLT